jgi:hypothetical protein
MRTYKSKGAADIDLDGEVFHFAASAFELVEIQEKYGDIDVESAAAASAFADIFRMLLGDEYDRFRAHCSRNNTDAATLQDILNDAVEDLAGRPLASQPASPAGQPTTGPTLRVVSPAKDVSARIAGIERLGGEVSLVG